MFNFIFSPDWRMLSLALSVIFIVLSVWRDVSEDGFEEKFQSNIMMCIAVWIFLPIAIPIVILLDAGLNINFKEIKEFFKMFNFKAKTKSKNDAQKEQTQSINKKGIIENKIQEIISLFTLKKFYTSNDRGYYNEIQISLGYRDTIGIERYKDNHTKSIIESLGDISSTVFKYAEDKDYVRISNSLRDILISLIEFYSSVINDEFMKDSEVNDLIKSFYTEAQSIASELINDEAIKVRNIKKREAEEEKKRIEELAKFSYEKFSNAKDSMLEAISIGARIEKKQ